MSTTIKPVKDKPGLYRIEREIASFDMAEYAKYKAKKQKAQQVENIAARVDSLEKKLDHIIDVLSKRE